jgi:hypothetical protein
LNDIEETPSQPASLPDDSPRTGKKIRKIREAPTSTRVAAMIVTMIERTVAAS